MPGPSANLEGVIDTLTLRLLDNVPCQERDHS